MLHENSLTVYSRQQLVRLAEAHHCCIFQDSRVNTHWIAYAEKMEQLKDFIRFIKCSGVRVLTPVVWDDKFKQQSVKFYYDFGDSG